MTTNNERPQGCIGCVAYIIVYGLLALGFYRLLELLWGAIAT